MPYYTTPVSGGGGGGGGQTDTVTGANGAQNTGTNINAVIEPVYGNTANTVTEGDDPRLSDARTPTAHALSHSDGGSDELDVANLGSASAPAAAYVPTSDGTGGLGWTDSSTFGTGDVVGPSSSVDRAVVVFDGTTGKLIDETPFYISGLSLNPGTSTLGLAALVGVNAATDGGSTAEAIGNGESSILVGTADAQTGSTARIRSNFSSGKVGTVLIGAAVSSANASAVAAIEGQGSGAFGVGLATSNTAVTSQILANGDGCLVAGAATGGGTLEATTTAPGAFVQGFTQGGGTIRATSAASGARGWCSAGTIEATGTGNFVNGYSTGGTLRVQGSGSTLIGNAGAGTVAVQGGGALGVVFQTTGTATLGFGGNGSAMVVANLGGTVTHNGSGTILIGNLGAGSTLSSGFGANGSVAVGAGSGVTIAVNAANAAQIGVGTNAIATSAQIGSTAFTGIHICGGGVPGTLANGQIFRSGANIAIRSAGATQTFSQPTITGSRGGNAALTSLLSQLATMGLIVDSTT